VRVASFAAVLAVLACCSPFGGTDAKDDPTPPTNDAGTTSSSGAPTDAGAPPGSSGGDDAAVDAGPVNGAFCLGLSVIPAFCADFDGVGDTKPTIGWMGSFGNPKTLELATTHARSSPRALHVIGPVGGIFQNISFATSMQLDVDVFLPSLPQTGAFAPIDIAPTKGSGDPIAYEVESNKVYFQQGTTQPNAFSEDLDQADTTVWHHVSIKLLRDGTGFHVSVNYDGSDVNWTDQPIVWPAQSQLASVRLGFGVTEIDNGDTGGEAFIDNVVVKTQ
jgi:hypothetical protein